MTYNLQKLLVILGLIFVPFYEIILRILPFVRNISPDTRAPKELVALVFALSIGLLAVFQGTLKPFKNKWLLIIPVYLLFNLIASPHVDMFINNVESGDFYFWKPFVEILCFSLMIIAISSMDINFESVLKTMVFCGALMAGYVILQKLGFDQFWIGKKEQNFTAVTEYLVGGNLGQPTIVASFIVMIVPLAFYIKKYWMASLLIIATVITKSDMAILTLLLMGIIYLLYLYPRMIFMTVFIGIVLLLSFGIICSKSQNIKNIVDSKMSGRADVWSETYKDIKDGAIEDSHDYSITGVGLGRFAFIFPQKHASQFQQVHNDLLEFTYNCGIIGLLLLIVGLWNMFNINNISPMIFSVILSFIGILFISFGSFPFQLGAHQFYSAVLVGILHNRGVLDEKV